MIKGEFWISSPYDYNIEPRDDEKCDKWAEEDEDAKNDEEDDLEDNASMETIPRSDEEEKVVKEMIARISRISTQGKKYKYE
jgi:hypothetical protein